MPRAGRAYGHEKGTRADALVQRFGLIALLAQLEHDERDSENRYIIHSLGPAFFHWSPSGRIAFKPIARPPVCGNDLSAIFVTAWLFRLSRRQERP